MQGQMRPASGVRGHDRMSGRDLDARASRHPGEAAPRLERGDPPDGDRQPRLADPRPLADCKRPRFEGFDPGDGRSPIRPVRDVAHDRPHPIGRRRDFHRDGEVGHRLRPPPSSDSRALASRRISVAGSGVPKGNRMVPFLTACFPKSRPSARRTAADTG
jgi:hypothetical protein